MSTSSIKAIGLYKRLRRTVELVFSEDVNSLNAAKLEIRNQFISNRSLSDSKLLSKAFQAGTEAEMVLRTSVIQLVKESDSQELYKAQLRSDIAMDDAVPFRDDITDEEYEASIKSRKRIKKSCGESETFPKSK